MTIVIGASRTKRLAPRRWLFLSLVLVFMPLQALADEPPDSDEPPLDCQEVQQILIKMEPAQWNGFKLFCKGSYPYYWGNREGEVYWSYSNHCVWAAQWELYGNNSFADVLFHNWCLKSEPVTVNLCCSSAPPPPWPKPPCCSEEPPEARFDPWYPH